MIYEARSDAGVEFHLGMKKTSRRDLRTSARVGGMETRMTGEFIMSIKNVSLKVSESVKTKLNAAALSTQDLHNKKPLSLEAQSIS